MTRLSFTSGLTVALLSAPAFLPLQNALSAPPVELTRTFTGTVGRYPVRVTLVRRGTTLSGSYVYLKNGVRLSLRGSFRPAEGSGAGFPNAGEIELEEFDRLGRRSGRFEGDFTTPSLIRGSWWKTERPKDRLSFQLREVGVGKGPFNGSWSYTNRGYSFSLDLTQRGDRLEGSYCAVTEEARRVDCISPISGKVEGDSATVQWTSAYGGGTGSAVLTRTGEQLRWVLGKTPDTDFYAPKKATMRRSGKP